MTLADLHRRLSVVGGGSAHTLLDLPGHSQESLLDVAGVLGRGLEEWNAQAVSELLLSVVSKVGPITISKVPACDEVGVPFRIEIMGRRGHDIRAFATV